MTGHLATAAQFAAAFAALYVGHHVGDYWVQTDHQAQHKSRPGREGRAACSMHVFTYVLTQLVVLELLSVATGLEWAWTGILSAVAVSGATHYMADRREYGLMFWIARKLGKDSFMRLGTPRKDLTTLALSRTDFDHKDEVALDNPQLATGAWALDQSWHLFWGVFIAALTIGALS